MKSMLRLELRKAVFNSFFWVSLCIGLAIVLFSAGVQIEAYYDFGKMIDLNTLGSQGYEKDPMYPAFTLYNNWVGGEGNSVAHSAFYLLLPLLAAIPYCWSFCTEQKSGYTAQAAVRGGKRAYYLCKYIGVFFAGFLVILLPLLINLFTVALFIPARPTDPSYDIYYAVGQLDLFSELFYEAPLLYVCVFILLDAVFAGLFAGLGLAVSFLVHNRYVVILLPFFFALVLQYVSTMFIGQLENTLGEIAPTYFLSAISINMSTRLGTVLMMALLFVGVGLGAVVAKSGKHDML